MHHVPSEDDGRLSSYGAILRSWAFSSVHAANEVGFGLLVAWVEGSEDKISRKRALRSRRRGKR